MIPSDAALRIVQGMGDESDSLLVTTWMLKTWGTTMSPEKCAFWIRFWVDDNIDKRDQLQRWRVK